MKRRIRKKTAQETSAALSQVIAKNQIILQQVSGLLSDNQKLLGKTGDTLKAGGDCLTSRKTKNRTTHISYTVTEFTCFHHGGKEIVGSSVGRLKTCT
jgi:hypothetical protein